MKTRLLSGLLSLLGFSGIAASCNNEEYQSAGEYGTPYARFTFKGTVTDAEAEDIYAMVADGTPILITP